MDLRLQLQGKQTASEAVVFEMLSAEYGWTPIQIREQRLDDIIIYIKIINTRRKLEKHNNMKHGQ